jgi:Fe-S-cluster containining protein
MTGDDDERLPELEELAAAAEKLERAHLRYREYVEARTMLGDEAAQVRDEVAQTRQTLRNLCKVLLARGQLAPGHLRIVEQLLRAQPERPRPRLRVVDDKRAITGPAIDCASRFHLCQGRCCTLGVDLSREDLADGVQWEIDEPYRLRHDGDGWCHYIDRATGGCTIYERRPATCREFDCRGDDRVWIDFDARIPAPLPAELDARIPPFAQPPGPPRR